ncbi:MAG: hypothetical protein IKA61_06460 [Clostridia bacterium]|nr:hypothetical protein [Clostridia bacterium]
MVKFILGLITVVTCTLIGKKITSKYLYELSFFECLLRFNLHLKQNLKFKRDSLIELLDYKCNNEDFCTVLSSFKLSKSSMQSNSELYFPSWTSIEDRQFLVDYFNSLGTGNSDSEIENLNLYDELINEKLCKISDKSSKYSNMGQKLGFSFGMAIFIIII